nr:MAG TPA: hypothetical protein [Caudoviricetes sp.]
MNRLVCVFQPCSSARTISAEKGMGRSLIYVFIKDEQLFLYFINKTQNFFFVPVKHIFPHAQTVT